MLHGQENCRARYSDNMVDFESGFKKEHSHSQRVCKNLKIFLHLISIQYSEMSNYEFHFVNNLTG